MTKTLLAMAVSLMACATDPGEGGGGGDDALPKRGEMASDPTIVSATAECREGIGEATTYLHIRIDGSDPMGSTNLGTCAVTIGSTTDQGTFSEDATCNASFVLACTVGQAMPVLIVVSNETAGVTTASVTLTTTRD